MPGHTRLFRRSGTYYLRAKVPEKIRAIIGKREIQKSLKTRDYKEAVKLIKPLSIKVDIEFDQAWAKLEGKNDSQDRPTISLSDAEIWAIVYDCFIREERKNEAWLATEGGRLEKDDADAIVENLGMDLTGDLPSEAAPSYNAAKQLLGSYLSTDGVLLAITPESEVYRKLLAFAQRAYVEATSRHIDRLEQNGIYQRRDAAFEKLTAQSELPSTQIKKSITLGAFLDSYEAHQADTKSAATVKAIKLPLRVLREVLGNDAKLRDITKDHMEAVADTLRAIPKNMEQRYPGMSIRAAISAGERDGLPKRGKATLANNWIHIVGAFNFAKDDDLIEESPIKSKRFRATFQKSKQSTRRPFLTDELNKLFGAPLYCARDEAKEIASRAAEPHRFWIPLLGLFEGCRLNEICQMDTADVQQDGEIPFLSIDTLSESGTKSRKQLKTKDSRRRVPIHPILLKLGFMSYVEKRRDDCIEPKLFPGLRFDKSTSRFSSSFSKQFSNFVRKVCGQQTTVTFHSFRHNFRDAMRNAQVVDEIAAKLGGWKAGGGVMNSYGAGFSLSQLSDAIAKVQYPGLDLSHLMPTARDF